MRNTGALPCSSHNLKAIGWGESTLFIQYFGFEDKVEQGKHTARGRGESSVFCPKYLRDLP